MLAKVQTLINSTADETKKEKFLKIKKNLENEIEKLTDNRGQNSKDKNGNKKPWEKNKFGNKKPWEKDKNGNKKPWEKDKEKKPWEKNKFGEKKYKKSYNNNVSF